MTIQNMQIKQLLVHVLQDLCSRTRRMDLQEACKETFGWVDKNFNTSYFSSLSSTLSQKEGRGMDPNRGCRGLEMTKFRWLDVLLNSNDLPLSFIQA